MPCSACIVSGGNNRMSQKWLLVFLEAVPLTSQGLPLVPPGREGAPRGAKKQKSLHKRYLDLIL